MFNCKCQIRPLVDNTYMHIRTVSLVLVGLLKGMWVQNSSYGSAIRAFSSQMIFKQYLH
jgi:hypothetical protein